jgi:hypothetical protein
VSLPSWFVFRVNADDPHPAPWIRVKLSCAIGDELFPHPQWGELSDLWESMYPRTGLPRDRQVLYDLLEETVPRFAAFIVRSRPPALRGRSLAEVMPTAERSRARLMELHRAWKTDAGGMRAAPPTLAFAVIGQARLLGAIGTAEESRRIADLLTYWAMRSTLDMSELCATPPVPRRARPGDRVVTTA